LKTSYNVFHISLYPRSTHAIRFILSCVLSYLYLNQSQRPFLPPGTMLRWGKWSLTLISKWIVKRIWQLLVLEFLNQIYLFIHLMLFIFIRLHADCKKQRQLFCHLVTTRNVFTKIWLTEWCNNLPTTVCALLLPYTTKSGYIIWTWKLK